MSASSMRNHVESIHVRSVAYTREAETGVGGRETYVVSFPRVLSSVAWPVEEFLSRDHILGRLW